MSYASRLSILIARMSHVDNWTADGRYTYHIYIVKIYNIPE